MPDHPLSPGAGEDSIPLEPRGVSTGIRPAPFGDATRPRRAGGSPSGSQHGSDDENEEWTWDTFPLSDILSAAWSGAVGGPAAPAARAQDSPSPHSAHRRDTHSAARGSSSSGTPASHPSSSGGGDPSSPRTPGDGLASRMTPAESLWEDFDVSQYADPSKALAVILLLGVLFWIFPQFTLPALGWTWRHTLGYPFQPSSVYTSSPLGSPTSCVPPCAQFSSPTSSLPPSVCFPAAASHPGFQPSAFPSPSPLDPFPNLVASPDSPHGSHRTMPWQREFTLRSRSKGVHLVTREVEEAIAEGLRGTQVGLLHLFIKHTSASLALGENWDSEVRSDMDRAMDHIVPEQGAIPWDHIDEGLDDSVSHTKNALFGSSVQIPITNGRLNLGTWQGVYLAEFRRMTHTRRIVATIIP